MGLIAAKHKPQALGAVRVATPGTKVSLVSVLIAAGLMTIDDAFSVNKITLWAFPLTGSAPAGWTGPTNAQTVYIGEKTMNKTTLAGVVATIPPGGFWSITNNVGANVYLTQSIWVDADSANDGVYGNVDQA